MNKLKEAIKTFREKEEPAYNPDPAEVMKKPPMGHIQLQGGLKEKLPFWGKMVDPMNVRGETQLYLMKVIDGVSWVRYDISDEV